MLSYRCVKCPEYWECGDYALMAREGSRPGKVEVRCAYHARRIVESKLPPDEPVRAKPA